MNTTKEHWSFRLIFLCHSKTEYEFFHWFTLFFTNMVLLTLSDICLLIFPISVLDGFIRWQEADRKRKSIIKIFKECGLSITCEVNKKIADFLEVRFNLNEQTYQPYRKSNNEPVYINIQSNHPPNIIADIPKAISKRLTNILCNKNIFDRNVGIYQAALKIVALMEK